MHWPVYYLSYDQNRVRGPGPMQRDVNDAAFFGPVPGTNGTSRERGGLEGGAFRPVITAGTASASLGVGVPHLRGLKSVL